jgi:ubiquinone biosynthesis protein COQ9
MPYFLNIINTVAIFIMLSIYFVQNVLNGDKKKDNQKILHYEISSYIYIAILASLINIMNSINLSDAVFWYGVSLSFGVKNSIFIVVIAGLLIYISVYFSKNKQQESDDTLIFIKDLQETVLSVKAKQVEVDEKIADFVKRFKQIATPEEVDEKISEMVDNKLDSITDDIQNLSDKTAIIAEQLAIIKGGNSNMPSVIEDRKMKKRDWMDDDEDEDVDKDDN